MKNKKFIFILLLILLVTTGIAPRESSSIIPDGVVRLEGDK